MQWQGKIRPAGIGLNSVAGWQSALEDRAATHMMVMSDDMQPVRWFSQHTAAAVAAAPVEMVALFTGVRRHVERARQIGVHWVRGLGLFGGNGTVLSRAVVEDFLEFVEQIFLPVDPKCADDNLYTAYQVSKQLECWATVPCLLEHFAPRESTIGHNSPILTGRTAPWFEADLPTPVDWQANLPAALKVPPAVGTVTKRLLARWP